MSKDVREAAACAGAVEILLDKLEGDITDGTLAGACLDALLALLANSTITQKRFLESGGLEKATSGLCVLNRMITSHTSSCLQLLKVHYKPTPIEKGSCGVCCVASRYNPLRLGP